MKNKLNFFFDNRGFPNWGWGGGRSATWEFFPHNPVFFSDDVPKYVEITGGYGFENRDGLSSTELLSSDSEGFWTSWTRGNPELINQKSMYLFRAKSSTSTLRAADGKSSS